MRLLRAVFGFPAVWLVGNVGVLTALPQQRPHGLYTVIREVGVVGAVVSDQPRFKQRLRCLHGGVDTQVQLHRGGLLQGRGRKRCRWFACLRLFGKVGHDHPLPCRCQHRLGNGAVGDQWGFVSVVRRG